MFAKQRPGSLEVICGPMFSGKSEELIRRVKRALIARQKVQVFKPAIDDRYHATAVASHSQQKLDAVPVRDSSDIRAHLAPDTEVVAFDEAQFMDEGTVALCDELADRGVRVIVAGLDQDYTSAPFGIMPVLLAKAEFVSKLQAICVVCGALASRTNRLVHKGGQVLVGAAEAYDARCRHCHEKPGAGEAGLFGDAQEG
ncbi:MAG: thymidine kinase [Acidobacteria bacterium]|nr:thymidine kinase [Acidobacteriota bacterium]